MKTRASKRLALLTSMVLLAMAVLGASLQAASAMLETGGGVAVAEVTTTTAPGDSAVQTQSAQVGHDRLDAAASSAGGGLGVETAASGAGSATTWAIIAVLAGILLVGFWLGMRRRGRERAAHEATCTTNPQAAGC